MRLFFIDALKELAIKDKNIIFLTGDVGYHALEDYRDTLEERFINAGIAEQNMVTVAAGMASIKLKPWVYTIAPFMSLKSTEQIRNDVCHHDLSVKFIGNGGGYGYGIFGPSHHVLEDLAILLSMPKMKVYVPGFNEDLKHIVHKMYTESTSSYLRLGLVPDSPVKLRAYKGVRNIIRGKKMTVVALGPLIHNALDAIKMYGNSDDVDLWVVTELPTRFPDRLIQSLQTTQKLFVIEEHGRVGGLGDRIATDLLVPKKITLKHWTHHFATGYPSHTYGSQKFHQTENKLDAKSIYHAFRIILNND